MILIPKTFWYLLCQYFPCGIKGSTNSLSKNRIRAFSRLLHMCDVLLHVNDSEMTYKKGRTSTANKFNREALLYINCSEMTDIKENTSMAKKFNECNLCW